MGYFLACISRYKISVPLGVYRKQIENHKNPSKGSPPFLDIWNVVAGKTGEWKKLENPVQNT